MVERVPAEIDLDDGWSIIDRYIRNTRLRLRKMEPLNGRESLYKLGQKEVLSPPDLSPIKVTNIYLTLAEYEILRALPADELRKRRYRLRHDERDYLLDVFEGSHAGLLLAEVGFETDAEMTGHTPPPFAVRDVSHELSFTGGELAKSGAAAS